MDRYLFFAGLLRQYIRKFGVLKGPPLMLRLYRLYAAGSTEPVYVRFDRGTGIWLRPKLDLGAFQQVFVWDEYGYAYDVQPKSIIDAGANIGCASVYFARRYPMAKILAVEPTPSTYRMLMRNVADLPNVTAIQAAVWRENRPVEIIDEGVLPVAVQIQATSGKAGVVNVPGRTVDDLMAEARFDTVDLLKMDIEGAEEEVFRQPDAWINRVKCLIIEFHEWIRPGSEANIRKKIASWWAFDEAQQGENVILTRRSEEGIHA